MNGIFRPGSFAGRVLGLVLALALLTGTVHPAYGEPTESPQPTESVQPSESAQPTDDPQPSESVQPTDDPRPSESAQPTDDPRPSETPEPSESPQPSDDPEVIVDFDAYLAEQGFPESYHEGLRQLHEQYPNWIFRAQLTGLDWEESLDAQAVPGKSLVEPFWPSSWKMVSDATYDWQTNTWYPFDGRWVAASREAIAYYMDPRGWLDDTSVFQFLDQSFDGSVQTLAGVEQILAGSFMEKDVIDTDGKVLDYALTFYLAGETYGVNPYVLASMVLAEQGLNGSPLCSGNTAGYVGYFNFFNFGAYSSGGLTAVQMGLIYAKGGTSGTGTSYNRPWNSRLKSILGGSERYASNYIAKGQTTLYLKRYNVQGNSPYTGQYSTSIYSAKVEGTALAKGYDETMRENPLVFTIPVYENMPETACPEPTGDGAPNMKLSMLGVAGYELTPAFDDDILEYSLVVPPETQSVTIEAVPLHHKATVSGAGQVELTEVSNRFEIVVTAENGTTQTYIIDIARENPGISGTVTFSEVFTLSGTRIIFPPGTLAGAVAEQLVLEGRAELMLADGSGKEAEGVMMTGDRIQVYDTQGNEYGLYTAAVVGDTTGDGAITINDIIKIRNHLLGTSALTDDPLTAADANGDGSCTINDVILLRNHILGITTIS